MKRLLFTTCGILFFAFTFGQRLSQITLSSSGSSDVITFITEDAIIINLSTDGKVIDFGIDGSKGRYYNDPGRLDKYMGRIEYFGPNDNEAMRGKVKYLGRTAFTYYSSSENEVFKGKIKSIGTNLFDYYNSYEDAAFKGKVKAAGITSFSYYSSFENEAFRTKLKSIGNAAITWYSSFDDKAFRGKIKSIGSHAFTYYSSFDRQEYRGTMKGGYQREFLIDGMKYLLGN